MKKMQLGLFIALLALSASAFTKARQKTADWYFPVSSSLLATSPAAQDFSSYVNNPINEPTCRGGDHVCAGEFPNTSQPPTEIVTQP
jgi:hypothetical protein